MNFHKRINRNIQKSDWDMRTNQIVLLILFIMTIKIKTTNKFLIKRWHLVSKINKSNDTIWSSIVCNNKVTTSHRKDIQKYFAFYIFFQFVLIHQNMGSVTPNVWVNENKREENIKSINTPVGCLQLLKNF